MNKNQAIALAFAAGNLLLLLLFPPFDSYTIVGSKIPVFSGFEFYPRHTEKMVVNFSLLYLEIMVVLINTCIGLLLLRDKTSAPGKRPVPMQNSTLIFVAANLTVIALFPPFESVFAITNATLPTFEGFYFVFSRRANHVIVTTLLYLEVILVLVNGALFWLLFAEKRPEEPSIAEAILALSAREPPKK
ncbi:MAG: hypothetical protein WCK07_10060 [Betaproteobacteria bacterium]